MVNEADPIRHHDVVAFAKDAKPSLLKGANGMKMVDAWKLRHG
jgi:hypothetical protein